MIYDSFPNDSKTFVFESTENDISDEYPRSHIFVQDIGTGLNTYLVYP